MQRGLERAAAYEAADLRYPILSLVTAENMGEEDCTIANAALQTDAQVAPSVAAMQRGLERAAAYEAADMLHPVVSLVTAENMGEEDCTIGNHLLQSDKRVAPSVAAMQRGLSQAGAYEAADMLRPVVSLVTALNMGEEDCTIVSRTFLHSDERVAPSVHAMQRGVAQAAAYEAIDMLDAEYWHDSSAAGEHWHQRSLYIRPLKLSVDMTAVNTSLTSSTAWDLHLEGMRRGVARKQERLLARSHDADEMLLRALTRNAGVREQMTKFMAAGCSPYSVYSPNSPWQTPLPPPSQLQPTPFVSPPPPPPPPPLDTATAREQHRTRRKRKNVKSHEPRQTSAAGLVAGGNRAGSQRHDAREGTIKSSVKSASQQRNASKRRAGGTGSSKHTRGAALKV